MPAEPSEFKAPVPVDPEQWPEARSFRRVYALDPDRQSRLAKALLGFRQDLLEWHSDEITVSAIDIVLRTFYNHFPEFMEDGYDRGSDSEWGSGAYQADERLLRSMQEIIEQND
jgi:hypothetical protein